MTMLVYRTLVYSSMITAVSLGLASTTATAQAPDTMSVQIFVTDSTGVPLDTSGVTLFVGFYQGASLKHFNSILNVVFVDGIANLALDMAGFALDREYDMGIKIGGVEFLPRTSLRSAPYALSLRGLRVFPKEDVTYGVTPNLIGGARFNRARLGVFGATIGGGGGTLQGSHRNLVLDQFGTIGGGLGNEIGADTSALGTALAAAVLGGRNNKALSLHAGVVAGQFNVASGSQSFVGGGQSNRAEGSRSLVAGGAGNVASGLDAVVGGGDANVSSGSRAFVGGGEDNVASGNNSTVAGGFLNVASGNYSAVIGGQSNAARGFRSFAGGQGAKANHAHSFVWNGAAAFADSLNTTGDSQFIVRANGGLHYWHEDSLVVTADERGLIPGANGIYDLGTMELKWDSLFANYFSIFSSDRNLKEDIVELDYGLEQALALRPVTYHYKAKPGSRRQMGLIAQETAEVVPEVVVKGGGTMGIQYGALIPLLISAIQDQQKLIDAQSARIDALEAMSDR